MWMSQICKRQKQTTCFLEKLRKTIGYQLYSQIGPEVGELREFRVGEEDEVTCQCVTGLETDHVLKQPKIKDTYNIIQG